jgi:hypothetical protein
MSSGTQRLSHIFRRTIMKWEGLTLELDKSVKVGGVESFPLESLGHGAVEGKVFKGAKH